MNPEMAGDLERRDVSPSVAPDPERSRFWLNLVMFAVTVPCMFAAGAINLHPEIQASLSDLARLFSTPRLLWEGRSLALPLLAILLFHEFGHYIAARLHRVPASLPFFLPLPVLSPFGTAGAIISMRGRIRSRDALLDIGAAGPLAGLFVAIPVLAWGIAHSTVVPHATGGYLQEGQSLLYWAMKRLIVGPIPEGSDIFLHPTAYAGWGGLLITMLNLLPFGQLDGGHIAFALFGQRQNQAALWIRRALLLIFVYNFASFALPVALGRSELGYLGALGNSLFWLMWFGLLGLLTRFSGDEHPPFEPGPLSRGRQAVAWLCLALFVLLFMPTPMAMYP
jgi:membrane-associated protease RseP (regulator of RpoE activity)